LEISSIHQYVSDLISGTKPILDFHGVQYRCSLQKVLNKDKFCENWLSNLHRCTVLIKWHSNNHT